MSRVPTPQVSDWQPANNYVSKDMLRHNLEMYSRDPFADLLAEILLARPDNERLQRWAKEKPGEWINGIKILALLTGYTEKTESTSVHKHLHLHKMSDAELIQTTQMLIDNDPSLLADLKEMDKRDRARAIDQIDAQPVEQGAGSETNPIFLPLEQKEKQGE